MKGKRITPLLLRICANKSTFRCFQWDMSFQCTQMNIQNGRHPYSVYSGQDNLMAKGKKKELTTKNQDMKCITYVQIPFPKYSESYDQAQSQCTGSKVFHSRDHFKSHGKGQYGETGEQLGTTIHSATALYHKPLIQLVQSYPMGSGSFPNICTVLQKMASPFFFF